MNKGGQGGDSNCHALGGDTVLNFLPDWARFYHTMLLLGLSVILLLLLTDKDEKHGEV